MKISKSELKEIISNWKIGKIINITKAKKGNVNHNWIIKTSKSKFILRKPHDEYKAKDIEFELSYLEFFKKKKFPYEIPQPIKTKNNKRVIKTNKGFFWIYKFIEGKHNNHSGEKELLEIAKMITIYHNILEKLKLKNEKPPRKNFDKKSIAKDIKDNLEGKKVKGNVNKLFQTESEKLLPILNNLDSNHYNSLKKYPVHRDLNPENFLWKNNKISAIIDFDNVSYTNDSLIQDMVIVMQYSCSDKSRKLSISKARSFIKKYKKFRKLSEKDIETIISSIISTYIEDFAYAYWMLIHDPKRAKVSRLKKYSNAAQEIFKDKEKILKELTK